MKFAVLGGTGRIGSRIVAALAADGHTAVPHSRATGLDLSTGRGLRAALDGMDAVIDAAQAPAADATSLDFFRGSATRLAEAAGDAGVRHLVALSIVGVDTLPDFPYYRAKSEQENILRSGPVPYSLVRATQFFEYLDEIFSWTTDGDTVRLPSTPLQPVAAADAARAAALIAAGPPLQGIREVAGPEVLPLDELGRIVLAARGDGRRVVTDDSAGPFAPAPGRRDTAAPGAEIAPTGIRTWLAP
ncbi:SDR family oxidoreductase [Streptomyces indicus]|uniref:Uncharacterized conserved protein YbjT, contains NAD(P)-binding and DUF2867 domains n=1 Tax=Streptomyces indicus TaxID=417292 RepID=A0A1G9HLD5_9ACTN|nr:SDR family oxidoreductase [Streptomyces indicus]SDL13692.1 Uncharacterized conserved protein YbjT, contains NAD(P)-binding and DUF2867 domains [Streptomyces indicus]